MNDARKQATLEKLRALSARLHAGLAKTQSATPFEPLSAALDLPREIWIKQYLALLGDERERHVVWRMWDAVRAAGMRLAYDARYERRNVESIGRERGIPHEYTSLARRLAKSVSLPFDPPAKNPLASWPVEAHRALALANAIELRMDELLREERRASVAEKPTILAKWLELQRITDDLRNGATLLGAQRPLPQERSNLRDLIARFERELEDFGEPISAPRSSAKSAGEQAAASSKRAAPASSRRGVFDPASFSPLDAAIDIRNRAEWLARYLAWRAVRVPEEGVTIAHTKNGWTTNQPSFPPSHVIHDATYIVQRIREKHPRLVREADNYRENLYDACRRLGVDALNDDTTPEDIVARRGIPSDYARCTRRLMEARPAHIVEYQSKLTNPTWPAEVREAASLADVIEQRADELLRAERSAPPSEQPAILVRWSALAIAAEDLRREINEWSAFRRNRTLDEEHGFRAAIEQTKSKLLKEWGESFQPTTRSEAP